MKKGYGLINKTQFFASDTILKDGQPMVRYTTGINFKTSRVRGSRIFSTNNSKINLCGETYNERMVSYDLPAGHSCPAAVLCLTFADKESGKVTSGVNAKFNCYAAVQEAVYKNTRALRHRNLELTKRDDFVSIITDEIAKFKITAIRIHSSGDFYNLAYAKKWIEIARLNPNVRFFIYTKMATFVKLFNAESNMFAVYSNGGFYDGKNILNGIPTNTVVTSHEHANELGLTVTCEANHKASDYEMILNGKSFSIVIHGTQKKSTNDAIKRGERVTAI